MGGIKMLLKESLDNTNIKEVIVKDEEENKEIIMITSIQMCRDSLDYFTFFRVEKHGYALQSGCNLNSIIDYYNSI
jgi:hypothetical protein